MSSKSKNSSRRVLVADDDPVIRHLVSSQLRLSGYVPVEAPDGREAYKILQSDSDFRAAVIDLVLPYLEGIDLISYMRTEKRLRRIPAVMITAEKDLSWLSKSFSAGATLFLAKPFTPDQLQKTLQLLLTAASIESRTAA